MLHPRGMQAHPTEDGYLGCPCRWAGSQRLEEMPYPGPLASLGWSLALTAWPWGCLCSAEERFEDTREKTEGLLGELFSSSCLQMLLRPKCEPWPVDVQPLLDKQSDDRQG